MLHVDLADRMDSSYFQKYLTSRGLSDRIQTVWKTDQANKSKLSHFMRTMFDVSPDLIIELIESVGSWTNIINDIPIYRGFVAIERGPRIIEDPASFSLNEHIYRRSVDQFVPPISGYQRIINYLKHRLCFLIILRAR